MVSKLRNLGYSTDYDINGRTISKQFHEAALKKAAAIIIISLDEFKKSDKKHFDQGLRLVDLSVGASL